MNRLLLVIGMVASVVVGVPAWALPSVYDGFDYANDSTSLEGQTGGYGWAGPWTEVGGDLTTFQFIPSNNDTSLDQPNLPFTPSGDHVVATGPGSGGNNNYAVRPMTSEFSLAEDNSFYVSYLMQKTGGPGTASNNQELNLYDGGTASLRMGSTSTNTYFLGVATNTIPSFTINYGDTYFVVAKVAASAAGTDVASVAVFDSTETVPASEPAAFDATYNFPAARANDVIDTVRLWIGGSAAGMFDEVRLGRTWQDVTSANPNYILGDFDQSGAILPNDYQTLASNLYTGTTYEQGDINFSGRVDLNDFAIFRNIYTAAGFTLPPGAPGVAVPEPATWLVLAGAAVGIPLWLRRRQWALRATCASGLFLLVLLSSPAYAVVVAYEGFDYPNDSTLMHNRSGGTGWTTGWLDNDMDMNGTLTADNVSLTSPVFPFAPVGDRVSIPSGGVEANRFFGNSFDMSVDGTTVYGSLLMQKVGDGGASNDAMEFRLISPGNIEGLRMGFGSDEGMFFDSGAQSISTGPGTMMTGVNYFFVFKAVSSAEGNDQFFLSSFSPTEPVPATEPTTWDLMLEEAVGITYSGARMHTGSATAGSLYDEIRIGQTWADVAVGTSFVLGDFNGSSAIDPGDLSTLMSNLYTGNQYSQGDIDFNGVVDLRDYNAFRTIYTGAGFVLPAANQVPEPTAIVIVSMLLVGVVVGRRVWKSRVGVATLAVVVLVGVASPNSASAQGVEYIWQPTTGEQDWNVDANWLGNGTLVFVPDTSQAPGDTALFPAGAANSTATVTGTVPRIGQLNMDGGTVRISGTGVLETHVSDGTSGAVVLDNNGRLEVRDSGDLVVGTVASISGGLHVYGPSATVTVGSDMLMSGGTLGAHITAGTHSTIMVGGTADLAGTLTVDISNVTPVNGNSWNLVTATGGITRMFENVVIENAPTLARGLQYRAAEVGNTARLEVGNTLVVTIDRQTGEATVENPVGSGITLASYALQSGSGSLNPAGLASLNTSGTAGTGWTPGPQTTSVLVEQKHNSTFTLGVGQSVSLGNPYALGVLPGDEDLAFDFTTTDGRVLEGIVEYVGAVNDFTLFIDPQTGEAAIGNISSFVAAPDVTGYAILSSNDQLVPGNWTRFQTSGDAGTGWVASPASAAVLAETNIEDSHAFNSGTVVEVGSIFTPGGSTEGLTFEYTVAGELAARTGTITFGPIPDAFVGLVGDYNDDNVVDAADYVVWRNNVGSTGTLENDPIGGTIGGAHYLQWKANYGATASGALALAPQSVPEPATVAMWLVGLVGVAAWRGRGKA